GLAGDHVPGTHHRRSDPDRSHPRQEGEARHPQGRAGRWEVRFPDYRSTSPTTKKMLPRTAIRSGISAPGRSAGMTDTFENDAVRILRRYGSSPSSPTT